MLRIIVRQLADPVVWMLLVAGALSAAIGRATDTAVILLVVAIHVVIAATHEASARRSVQSLQEGQRLGAVVVRGGTAQDIDAAGLVPGDVVLLDEGDRVPADLRIVSAFELLVDQSSLTGESEPQPRQAGAVLADTVPIADRSNMLLTGTHLRHGQARGLVVSTAGDTELGRIAGSLARERTVTTPLLERTRQLSRQSAVVAVLLVLLVLLTGSVRGLPFGELSLIAVALAVSAIPEGLPLALTIALALSARRLGRRQVLARRIAAVETLGSCTAIASDKTGTMTLNQLTVSTLWLPGDGRLQVGGTGLQVHGELHDEQGRAPDAELLARAGALARAAARCSHGSLSTVAGQVHGTGDPVDLALLVLAAKLVDQSQGQLEGEEAAEAWRLPFDAFERLAATVQLRADGTAIASVKGAVERILAMCSHMATPDGRRPLDASLVTAAEHQLAARGLRVLGVASGPIPLDAPHEHASLQGLTLRGLAAMSDPPRPGTADAIASCHRAGIRVLMVTGDHLATAVAVARDLHLPGSGYAADGASVAALAGDHDALDELVARTAVFARIDPLQKLAIVESLQRSGQVVAVTGDGANDAPALKAAHVGVAMGMRGTDLARDAADIVLADDDFSSIVAGIEEGRIAYANIRKVVFLLASTSLAEIFLFLLSFAAGLPAPLVAVQVLWLNLVANGIQDIGLALEPGEGDELTRPARAAGDRIFDRLMLERCALSAATMALGAFALFAWRVDQGSSTTDARNPVLLMMVLFENMLVGLSRSESHGVLLMSPLRNPWLAGGTATCLLVHVVAMYAPPVQGLLGTGPVSVSGWLISGAAALGLFVVVELHKLMWWRVRPASRHG